MPRHWEAAGEEGAARKNRRRLRPGKPSVRRRRGSGCHGGAEHALHILPGGRQRGQPTLIRMYLKNSPHWLEIAENGGEAVDLFHHPDLSIWSHGRQMPLMDGYAATRVIRRWEGIRERTGRPSSPLRLRLEGGRPKSHEAGCDGHVTKPLKKGATLETIARFGAGRKTDIVREGPGAPT